MQMTRHTIGELDTVSWLFLTVMLMPVVIIPLIWTGHSLISNILLVIQMIILVLAGYLSIKW